MNSETMMAAKKTANLRVYWGHQSVGGNILEGLNMLLSKAQIAWPIVELGNSPLPAGPALLHEKIGTNGTPIGTFAVPR